MKNMLKKSKLYKKMIAYVCEYLGINYHFFHRRALLKLDYKIGISEKKTKLSHQFYKNILEVFTQKDEITQDSSWLKIFNNFHKNIIEIIQKDKSKIEDILDNPSKYNLFYGFDNNCEFNERNRRFIDYYENDELVIDKILNFAEFLGILRHNNPEHFKIIFKKPNLDILISEIERKINLELEFKNVFPGEKGVKTQKGIVSSREIQAIYQAYQITKCKLGYLSNYQKMTAILSDILFENSSSKKIF